LFLAGCTSKDISKESHGRTTSAERKQAIQSVIDAGPQTKSWQTPEGTVIELTIPKTSGAGNFLESQRCIVWRDAVTKTSSMHCDKEEIDIRDYSGDPPEHQQ
jgi:hypothetical protein